MDGAGINLFPVNLVEALKNRKVQIGIAAVAVLLAVALTLVWVLQPKNDNPQAGATAGPPTVRRSLPPKHPLPQPAQGPA